MSNDDPREEALRRLDERASALGARTQRPVTSHAAEQAVGQAYQIILQLVGGVLIGMVAGFFVDKVFRIGPWGLIGGVLLGFALSIWMAKNTADRLMALARRDGEPKAVPYDDEDDEA
jgi:ATP synthase protein I